MHRSNCRRYSITSSAISRIGGGTVRPSVVAVLRLTTMRSAIEQARTAFRRGECDPRSWPSDEIYLGS